MEGFTISVPSTKRRRVDDPESSSSVSHMIRENNPNERSAGFNRAIDVALHQRLSAVPLVSLGQPGGYQLYAPEGFTTPITPESASSLKLRALSYSYPSFKTFAPSEIVKMENDVSFGGPAHVIKLAKFLSACSNGEACIPRTHYDRVLEASPAEVISRYQLFPCHPESTNRDLKSLRKLAFSILEESNFLVKNANAQGESYTLCCKVLDNLQPQSSNTTPLRVSLADKWIIQCELLPHNWNGSIIADPSIDFIMSIPESHNPFQQAIAKLFRHSPHFPNLSIFDIHTSTDGPSPGVTPCLGRIHNTARTDVEGDLVELFAGASAILKRMWTFMDMWFLAVDDLKRESGRALEQPVESDDPERHTSRRNSRPYPPPTTSLAPYPPIPTSPPTWPLPFIYDRNTNSTRPKFRHPPPVIAFHVKGTVWEYYLIVAPSSSERYVIGPYTAGHTNTITGIFQLLKCIAGVRWYAREVFFPWALMVLKGVVVAWDSVAEATQDREEA